MRKLIKWAAASLAVMTVATSCDESNVGGSTLDSEALVIEDTTTVICVPEINDKVPTRTLTHVLGTIKANGYGTLSSDFVTEFMPASGMDTVGVSIDDIDSTRLLLRVPLGSFVGDSIAPMKVSAYKLKKNLPYPIYSDFDPKDYYDESDLLGSRAYAMTTVNQDSVLYKEYDSSSSSYNYYYQISITMPDSFNKDLYNLYKTSPETFKDPEAFAKFFPGVYATTTYGNGRIVKISSTLMRTHYKKHDTTDEGNDTVYNYASTYLGAAPEAVTNNNVHYTPSAEVKALYEAGEPILVSPAGYNCRIKLPINDIVTRYRSLETSGQTVLNTIGVDIPATSIANDKEIEPPTYLLLVKASEKDDFFESESLPDSKTSFYATYDSMNKIYQFSGIRAYVKAIIDGEYADESQDEIEDFYLIPVDAEFTTSSSSYYSTTTTKTLNTMTPQLTTPAMAKLGTAKVVTTYSKKNY